MGEEKSGEAEKPKEFVILNVYANDYLTSLVTEIEAVSLPKKIQKILAKLYLQLHKTASNSSKVMDAFQLMT